MSSFRRLGPGVRWRRKSRVRWAVRTAEAAREPANGELEARKCPTRAWLWQARTRRGCARFRASRNSRRSGLEHADPSGDQLQVEEGVGNLLLLGKNRLGNGAGAVD